MAEVVIMPTLGQSMEEGTVVRWFKNEGETVRKGEVLLEVMTDKANIEVESEFEGTVRRILVPADGTVPINTPIALIGSPDELLDTAAAVSTTATTAATSEASPAKRFQRSEGKESGTRLAISPRARRFADEHAVEVSLLAGLGSGPGGRVLEKDVARFLESAAEPVKPEALALGLPGSEAPAEPARTVSIDAAVREVIPLRGLRKAIAQNVAASRRTAPHVTLVLEVDMTEALGMAAQLKPEIERAYSTKLTPTDVIVKASARALADHPLCNAALIGDEIHVFGDYNVGVAVATDNGLIVPVIKNADRKTLGEISVELKALAEHCRTGKQTPDDLAGGTFTITNLGAFGIDVFDPIIVPPQSCILGVGRIAQKPIALEGELAIRPMMNLCLSFDHRVLDGVPAARFLQRMKEILEAPVLVFV